MTANLCGLCERPLFGRASTAYLGPGCAESTAERLGELPGMYELLEEMLLPGSRGYHGAGRRPVHAGAPTSLGVIDARAAFDVLTTWRGSLYEALDWEPPGLPNDGRERVTAAVKVLLANITWIASDWPVAGDFAREIRELHRNTSSIVGTDSRGTRAGLCPTLHEGVLCGAPLRLPPGGKVIECKWCGATYPDGVWPLLRLAQDALFSPSASAAGPEGRPSRGSATAGSRG